MTRYAYSIILVLLAVVCNAQNAEPEMAAAFRSEGKIYVVISVIAMIFIALVIYLAMQERKIKKLEKKIQ